MTDIAWSERVVLASLIKSDDLTLNLSASDFSESFHRRVFEAVQALRARGGSVDIVELAESLGSVVALDDLVNATPDANAERHAEIVRDNAKKRQAQVVLQDALQRLSTPAVRFDEVVPSTQGMLEQIGEHGGSDMSLDQALQASFQDMAEARAIRDKGGFLGLNTGLASVNLMTDGLRPGQIIILAGRPSTGKTALALQMVTAANVPSGIISLEMGAKALSTRILAGHSGEDYRQLRRGEFYDPQSLAEGLMGRPVRVDESTYDIAGIVGLLAKWRRRYGTELAVIDYLGLVEGGKGNTRNDQVSDVSRQLKKAAHNLGMSILVLSQLNRTAAAGRPALYQLRDSGAIEQDADIVIALHADDLDVHPRPVDLGILKNREGMVGWMGSAPGEHWMFEFDGTTQKFLERRG